MRKLFTLLTTLLILLFLGHAVMGGFMLLGISTRPAAFIGCLTGILAVIHALWGCRYWLRTLMRTHSLWYSRANRLFWLRRLSGIAIILLGIFHWQVFGTMQGAQYILYEFTVCKLITQLLFVSAVCIHIGLNIRPLLLALGTRNIARHTQDMYSVLFIFYLFIIGSLIYYYVGWQSL